MSYDLIVTEASSKIKMKYISLFHSVSTLII